MDYRQKQSTKNEDEDDEDLEALRLAALQSLRAKDTVHYKKQTLPQLQKVVPEVTQTSRPSYKGQRPPRRGYFPNQLQQRRNGNLYYQSPRNPNLIAIVPVDEHSLLQQTDPVCPVEEIAPSIESHSVEVSKFHRTDMQTETSSVVIESSVETLGSSKKTEEDQDDTNDDDDDILLMADLEEEDSLERLMDEMEREMNVDKPSERKEKKGNKKGNKESEKKDEAGRNASLKNRTEDSSRKECCSPSVPVSSVINERRSMSPHISRILQKRRSLSPRSRSRKKSPRRSPRRSPIRQTKKSQREITRYRSPRKSPVRYSPRSRSPKLSSRSRSPRLSPRRSPNRSPIRRSPIKNSSSRGRSPRQSKSPRPIRSPKASLTKSPRSARSRSPKYSPLKLSPQSKSPLRSRSPKLSPRRISPPSRRTPPKSKSPGLSPRRGFSRLLSPKHLQSPRRMSPRSRSPRLSPHTSPWSSPRNSPRASPRRRRSPRWSPKELSRKHRPRSVSLDDTGSPLYIKESSPTVKSRVSPEISRIKIKQKEENLEKTTVMEKETTDLNSDPVLEARRRKFECARPIDPVNANKKIKLNKQENVSKKTESLEGETQSGNLRKVNKTTNDYEIQETDLCLDAHYEDFEDFEESMENTSPIAITSSVNSCIDVEPPKVEKERSSKKKKKRDKELYQVGKLKSELPLSERIGKDKKCKKRKDVVSDGPSEEMDAIFEDITIDEESDLRTELSRRRAERLNRTIPIQSARLVQSAFKGVVNEVVKSNAKTNQRHLIKADDKSNQKEVRRVTVLHRSIPEIHDSEDESTLDAKVPVRFRLGLGKQVQDTRESKISRKASKRQGRKVKHKVNLTLTNVEHAL
ncbi:PREDICTED: peptidyl-prolyl cis-trans isomerase CYP95-like [Dufourea novaeangliae]|uniref:peptidyl-prolyl cis-trans isomerase CYP95-like n=1 Tax=Dufourea novaeangliae TaxID=178035 RepID=UPI0007679DC7|nr:PREDICTED: peptidyl-prolyl cis-trans isomerase CYP95-like [Dufourea novaeangliae]